MAFPIARGGALVFALGLAGCGPKPVDPAIAAKLAALPQPTAVGLTRLKAQRAPYDAGDPARGRAAFAVCVDCHSFDPTAPQTAGPHLAGLFGARAASRTTYEWSPALRDSGIAWDAAHLDRWLFNPHEMMPATRMSFIGIRNDAKRYDVIAYLIAVSP